MVTDESWVGTFRLQVGDVIYLAVSIKGKSLSVSGAGPLGNPYPLWSDSERIPLRLVTAVLTPDEANLLVGFLATGLKSPPVEATLEQDIEISRIQLWNALVKSLIIDHPQRGRPAKLKVRMGEVSGEDHGFCHRLQRIGNLKDTFFVGECAGDLDSVSDIDIRYVNELNYPLSAITEDKTSLKSPQYQGGKQVAVSVAQIERHGASMSNKYGQEARWSLADWQHSGICVDQFGGKLYITALTLRSERYRSLAIAPPKAAARFDIRGSAIDREPPALDKSAPFETLTEASLSFLTPHDVVNIQWGREPGRIPALLSEELAPASRGACQP